MTDLTDPRDILLAPVISEKSYGLLDENKYTFIVRPDANKTQIKIAVEKAFDVKVSDVNTLNRQGKRKRTKSGFGKRADSKRAIVTLRDKGVLYTLVAIGLLLFGVFSLIMARYRVIPDFEKRDLKPKL